MTATLWILAGVASAVVMMAASRFALHQAVSVADKLHTPPFLVGITLVAIGTDTPELINSLVSSYLEHGDINVGDSIGSVFTQGSLALGLFPFVARSAFRVERREVFLIPGLTLAALGLGALVVRDGAISRPDAVLLVAAWMTATGVAWRYRVSTEKRSAAKPGPRDIIRHVLFALLALGAVGAAAAILVRAVVSLSTAFGVPEYILSFFGASVGTSLPEFVVELTALRRGHRAIALGDVLGSCLVDASLSVAIGPLLFPTPVTAALAIRGTMIAAVTMLLAGLLLGLRGRHDRVSGAVLVTAYLGAYLFLLVPG
jgi:cation:H+ antiporter